jgi:NAD/NADP transhydrogenase alpha subunit
MVPRAMDLLARAGVEFLIEPNAGAAAGFADWEYQEKGAKLAGGRAEVFDSADILLQVRTLGANPEAGRADLELFHPGQTVIGFSEPLTAPRECADLAARGLTTFAMELIPRITRAQSMDALSSTATVAGYKAVLREQDVVIATAAVPGKRAPILITREMAAAMRPGSVIVDLAAERGGNCELTQPGETVVENGVAVLGPLNLASSVPYHASQMYARNLAAFVLHLAKDGVLSIQLEDEITRETLITQGGEVVHPRVREALGLVESAA